ncbi:hypothetical protein NL463_31055, partial [Klebsiella pneumoniae]|nr:hypothetical protein [Klebsiella pneumoniae]
YAYNNDQRGDQASQDRQLVAKQNQRPDTPDYAHNNDKYRKKYSIEFPEENRKDQGRYAERQSKEKYKLF